MGSAKPNDIVFNDLADPKLTLMQKLALSGAKKGVTEFTQEAVLKAALETTGLSDFGNDSFREPLQVLLDDYANDEGLSGVGEQQCFKDLVRCASNHLIIQDRIKKTPELATTELKKPLSVSGLPRSGTTHLVNLLAADSRFQSLPLWVAQEPFHAPGQEKASPKLKFGARALTLFLKSGDSLTHDDPRYLRCSVRWSGMQIMGPDLAAMHPMNPDHIHEELELMTFDFGCNQFEWTSMVPGYRDYYFSKDQTPHYDYMVKVLKLLQIERNTDRSWVLKCVQNPEQLPALKAVMPDATAILTHRDPVAVIQSISTMIAYGHRILRTSVDPKWVLDYWTDRIEALLRACVRDRHVWGPKQSMDVMFHEFMAGDMATVEKIYDLHELELTPKARQEMADFIKAHPRGKYGRVRYYLKEHFGVEPDVIRERFGFYYDAFPVKVEF
ncbi:sulfotransferase family protein [Hellea balneolensis]|uniref:sulfotransferase family protein n=1 Tax=Hellea balneolensis TaxID=287478 RepID=UPI0003F5468E|nr:sulfotransferase [Hellea balneolensis]